MSALLVGAFTAFFVVVGLAVVVTFLVVVGFVVAGFVVVGFSVVGSAVVGCVVDSVVDSVVGSAVVSASVRISSAAGAVVTASTVVEGAAVVVSGSLLPLQATRDATISNADKTAVILLTDFIKIPPIGLYIKYNTSNLIFPHYFIISSNKYCLNNCAYSAIVIPR